MERDLVRWLCERLPSHRRMLLGPGDDAAILRISSGSNLVATTDMLMDGVDFELGKHEPERIGRKALAMNLSDLAAMAAKPVAALVSLALPRSGGEALAKRLYAGLLPLAAEFDCPIAGGDTNSWAGPLVISVTALGEVPLARRWTRAGAKPGDAILVTGEFGGSILGRQFDFTPRLREALWLAENVEIHAAIDVSDGLSLDLFRVCEASGCGAALDLGKIPVSAAAEEVAQNSRRGTGKMPVAPEGTIREPVAPDERTALDHALADGEDFELILAVPADAAVKLIANPPPATRLTQIGTFVAEPGLYAQYENGHRTPLTPRGYEHRLDS
jgi:thiamine-monophosphate kinase